MTRNKKAVLLAVGIIFLLIFLVLLLRNPEKNKSPAPAPTSTPVATTVPTEIPVVITSPAAAPAPTSSLHENVAELIDVSTKTITDEVPGLLGGLKNAWSWFTAFDTKHAIILGIVILFLLTVFTGGKKNKS